MPRSNTKAYDRFSDLEDDDDVEEEEYTDNNVY